MDIIKLYQVVKLLSENEKSLSVTVHFINDIIFLMLLKFESL